jgi:hypothetical protein
VTTLSDEYSKGYADGHDEGAEAMRVACWGAVQVVLHKHGWSGEYVVNDFKAAIEGATP